MRLLQALRKVAIVPISHTRDRESEREEVVSTKMQVRTVVLFFAATCLFFHANDAFSPTIVVGGGGGGWTKSSSIVATTTTTATTTTSLLSSFAADGSEYKSKDVDYDEEEVATIGGWENKDMYDEDQEAEVQELTPVPMSRNSGSRFVAVMWDQDLDTKERDSLTLHHDRNMIVEDHVMFCRKRNLYNDTFNTESMVDILKSLPM